jgi:hypothetical protein
MTPLDRIAAVALVVNAVGASIVLLLQVAL